MWIHNFKTTNKIYFQLQMKNYTNLLRLFSLHILKLSRFCSYLNLKPLKSSNCHSWKHTFVSPRNDAADLKPQTSLQLVSFIHKHSRWCHSLKPSSGRSSNSSAPQTPGGCMDVSERRPHGGRRRCRRSHQQKLTLKLLTFFILKPRGSTCYLKTHFFMKHFTNNRAESFKVRVFSAEVGGASSVFCWLDSNAVESLPGD